jgi:hypothetical protein
MTGTDCQKTCFGCVHRASRIRGSVPRSWCKLYHRPTDKRCEDYRNKSAAIEAALRYVKQMGIK